MATLLFNKPYDVICQFSGGGIHHTLADFIPVKGVYPAGRLDTDSEGLVVLTDDGRLQSRISHPRHKLSKMYWVQVEGIPSEGDLERLRVGVLLNDGPTLPAEVQLISEPQNLWARNPPIRVRKNIPTAWIAVWLHEGRNRQLRRMTAAIGHPALRLIRWQIGDWTLVGLNPGDWREISPLR
ncbi:MAG TPA: pseudouridine synthase [Gammaproteobacteria bacterium]|nr:pseudouridine synthase [Gammaproteobacteria bacterium]HVC28424.1 pseudouridine synthase [Gammaproteobacteria bacterium]